MNDNLKTVFLILISSFLGCMMGVIIYDHLQEENRDLNQSPQYAKQVLEENYLFSDRLNRSFSSTTPNSFIDAANASTDAVVSIRSFEDGASGNRRRFSNTSGSGVIIADKGFVITNYHVIENSENIIVTLNDRREFAGEVMGFDESTDLALLKIEATELDFLLIGNSDSLMIGEWVLAIGNPFRLTSSVTAGIVSAKARNINILENRGIESFIQTDAAINPGNSGGALINTKGELVGINTAIMTYSGKYEGFSFAIPSNLVKKVINDIREFGVVQRGWMGVSVLEMDEAKAEQLDLDFIGGVLLDFIEKNGAAKAAGFKKNDVITSIDGQSTMSIPTFLEKLASYRPGDNITLEFFRSGIKQEATLVLRNQLNTTDFIAVRKDKILKDLGFELRDLDQIERDRLNSDGVMVVSIYKESIIERTNMDPGYIITKINDKKISSADELIKLINQSTSSIFLEGFYENYPGNYPYSFSKN